MSVLCTSVATMTTVQTSKPTLFSLKNERDH